MLFSGNKFLVMAVLIFLAVVLLLEGVYLLWRASRGPEARKLHRRLESLSAAGDATPEARLLKRRLTEELPPFERLLMQLPRVHGIDRMLVQSGLPWSVLKLLGLTLAAFAAALVLMLGVAHQSTLFGLGAAGVVASLPACYVAWRRSRRLARIEQQLPDALDLIGRGLRAGHAFSSTLKMAGEELPEPVAAEFRTTHDEINFGVSMQQALSNLSHRVPSTDLRYFVVAVLIQRESGGNLTEILSNLSRLVRERLKLLAKVRVLSSEGRLSAWILALMPFALAALMNAMNPSFMSPLWTDPIGIGMVKVLLTLMFVGILILRKIIRIRY